MTKIQHVALGLGGALVAAYLVAKATAAPESRDLGYAELGNRSNRRLWLGTKLSPDPQPPAVYSHHVAHPEEIGAHVLTGRHPLYAHASSMSPNCHRVIAEGWDWMLDPPSEVVI